MSPPDLRQPTHIHVIGIGGAGMSAIATVLAGMGHRVSGSDLRDGPVLDRLRALGIAVAVGHDAAHLGSSTLVTISTAIPESNPEVKAARAQGLPVLRRAEMLAAICAQRRTIAVSGTHGKTTTASMLALILVEAGLAPSFIIGGDLNEIGTNAVWEDSEWLVVEADESDGTFLELHPEIALVTSVEPDHLEHYGTFAALRVAFSQFLREASTNAFLCADDTNANELAPPDALTYGAADETSYRIVDLEGGRADLSFAVEVNGQRIGDFSLPVPGEHNARNATGAIAIAHHLGIDMADARRALARFAGVARRFEFRGEVHGVTFVDDYAHLPGEVAAVLAAARRGGWHRIVCVFQPHRFSRVASIAPGFADAFVGADLLVITGIYSSGEAPLPGVSAKLILDAVLDAHPLMPAAYLPERAELTNYLRRHLRPGDCCLTCSAGDLTTLPDELLSDPTW